jgi:hypothetical protein
MRTEYQKFEFAMERPTITPQPGEIWELRRQIEWPGEFFPNPDKQLYSPEAENFLQGNTPPRYVMIVKEPRAELIVSVMVMSTETNFISDADLLVPAHVSGLRQDLLAETWHIRPMLVCNLLQLVGSRLSREIYDVLITTGDYYHGLVTKPANISTIERLGLKLVYHDLGVSEYDLFHQREKAWSDVLTIPVSAYCTYINSLNFTNKILNEILNIDQDELELKSSQNQFIDSLTNSFNQTQVILSRWWQNIFEPEWEAVSTVPSFATATRGYDDSQKSSALEEIAAIIKKLSSTDENQRQHAAKRLGEIGVGNSNAIPALVKLLRSTSDDETLWVAVESLQKLDFENPAAGIRRVKLIDLGMDIAGKAVALAVALLQKVDGDVSVLLQVYPTENNNYLPQDLKLILLDDSGEVLREVIARRTDVYIKLKFSCEIGEKFSLQLTLDDASYREYFVI